MADLAAAIAGYLVRDTLTFDDIGLDDYQQAFRRSAWVRYAYGFYAMGVSGRLGDYAHEDERVTDWVTRQVMPAVRTAGRRALRAKYYGGAMGALQWQADGLELRLAGVQWADPRLWFDGRPVRDPETAAITGWHLTSGQDVPFVNEQGQRQVVYWAPDDDEGSGRGDPVARRVYPHYLGLVECYRTELVGLDAQALARLIFPRTDPSQGQEYVNAAFQLGTNGAMAIDEEHAGRVQVIPGGFGASSPFSGPIREHIAGIFASFYEPPLLHTEAQFGTRAQAGTQLDTWLKTETAVAQDLIEEVLLEQIIAPGVRMQFGPETAPGSIGLLDATPMDLERFAAVLANLRLAGLYSPTVEEQVRWAGEQANVPVDELLQRGGLPEVTAQGEGRPPWA